MTIRTAEDMRAAAIAAAENERVPSAETTDAFYNLGISHATNAIRALPVASEWRPISDAPKDGTIFDVWIVGKNRLNIEFYCQQTIKTENGLWSGRSVDWYWKNDKFRPYVGVLTLVVFEQPTHFMMSPLPPEEG
jgi:hypothetical protein